MRDIIRLEELSTELGSFEVDNQGKIKKLSAEFCENFNLTEYKLLGEPLEKILIFPSLKSLSYIRGSQVVFTLIMDHPCLVQVIQLQQSIFGRVVLREQDVHSREILAFLKAIHPDNKPQTKKSVRHDYIHRYSFKQVIGTSAAMEQVKELAARVAKSSSTILLSGESGTGKELFAQAIHDFSPRHNGPFVAVNCAAIPEELFESELFGYEGGAFSGARREGKAGKVELAQHGTLFLDEISELPLLSQGKLLRVLQEREVERLGGTGRKNVDIRIIAATNRNLKSLVKEGKFRQDLYYRLHVFELEIPPLRERKEDIMQLVYHFMDRFNKEFGLSVTRIDPLLEEWFMNYSWPGNVRELEAIIERGMNVVEGDTLTMEHLNFVSKNYLYHSEESVDTDCQTLEEEVARAEISAIRRALRQAGGDRMKAAQLLNIHIASLYRKLAKYNLK